MRIGINLLCLLPGTNGGVEMYGVSTLRALAERYPKDEYVVFVNRNGAVLTGLDQENIKTVVCNFDGRSRQLRYAWEQFRLPWLAKKYRLDLLHSPGYQGPLRCGCPTVVTIPDLNFRTFAHLIWWQRRMALDFFCLRAARSAAQVITISDFSKQELIRHFGISDQKITVTHLGPGVRAEPANWELVSNQFGLDQPYIVAFAGNNHPHKNLSRLLQAFSLMRTSEPVNLAIIGGLSPALLQAAATGKGRLIDLGFVEGPHILPILSHARLCVFPSLYEGFGLPVLEAQSAGVPLACSHAASVPEVAGDGARFFHPESISDIVSAIEYCLSNPEYCESLVLAGRKNLRRFSWEKTADETRAVYEAVVGARMSRIPAGARQ